MGRSPCCAKQGMNRGAWSANEDKILSDFIRNHGEGGWRTLPIKAGLNRCGKSCRLRWLNYLRPDIKRGNISPDEEDLIIRLHKLLGNRWSLIAGRLPGRTDNEIKNYWNTYLGKKVQAGQNIRNTRKAVPAAEKTQKKTNIVVANKKSSAAAAAAAPVAVVRTKAVKCTRPIITNPANSLTNFNEIDHNYGPSSSSSMINAINKDSTNLQGGSSGVSNFSDFLMDSDIFDLFDFGQHDCGSKIDNINNNNIAGDHHDQNILQPPVIFPEEMLQNFCGAAVDSSVADPLESPNLDTFTSLLDFGLILETIDERDETNYMYN